MVATFELYGISTYAFQVSLDEVRAHNRELAEGQVIPNRDCIMMANGMGRLLQAPFDYSQAFDLALKHTVVAIPNRPAREAAEDVVRNPPSRVRIYVADLYRCIIVLLLVALENSHVIHELLVLPI